MNATRTCVLCLTLRAGWPCAGHTAPGYHDPMTAVATAELPAAFHGPPHARSPAGEAALWYTDPPGVVVQFVAPVRGTEEFVRWLVGPAAHGLFRRFAERDLVFVLDLARMRGRDLAARALLIQQAPTFRHRFSQIAVVPPDTSGAIVTNTLYAAAALLRTAGIPVDVAPTLQAVLRRWPLRALTR
jgi:hypothetical protein